MKPRNKKKIIINREENVEIVIMKCIIEIEKACLQISTKSAKINEMKKMKKPS